MTNYQLQAALRMTEGVRWYEWVGKTACGKVIRCQSRSKIKSPFTWHAVDDQRVTACVRKAF